MTLFPTGRVRGGVGRKDFPHTCLLVKQFAHAGSHGVGRVAIEAAAAAVVTLGGAGVAEYGRIQHQKATGTLMRYVRVHLGDKRLQTLTEDDVESLIDWMLSSARRIGGKPGTGVGVCTVSLTLDRLRSALNLAIRRGLVARNVASA